ncbi:hypothetical protein Ani05nite_41530 [Amorphoplanes nipponensis]|uniref:Uncharacterized protein n=1 Tax=Actinoplanes nipponensis TaxID=135950 RepID=A0A919JPK2_9ACTN|nr:hypothetical protein Ani05nite_41530 [Actinoplanes nipponensis]
MPDLTTYTPHRTVTDAAFDGVAVPGLRAEFFHRAEGDRLASAGRYSLGGRPLLLAWGWTDEPRCRFSAVRDPEGFWYPAVEGCPVVEILRDGEAPDAPVTGLALRTPGGQWVTADRTRARAR